MDTSFLASCAIFPGDNYYINSNRPMNLEHHGSPRRSVFPAGSAADPRPAACWIGTV